MSMASSSASTLGSHLARRLVQIGVTDIFSVPGDFNLTLLDHLIAEKGLTNIGCSNELSAGYAADGYARARGVSACVVTFTVGSLSLLNAIAGAYSENYPIICIVGGPNSNDYGGNRIIHHTVGLPDFNQELRCFENVTCYQAVVRSFENALELVDTAISTALRESKPVYISISCNLVAIPHATLSKDNAPLFLAPRLSNQGSLEAAVEAAGDFLNKAVKPILVGGPRLREAKAEEAFVEMAEACGYPMSVMPPAKGLVPEQHPQFIGLYWGPISSAFCEEAVESSDGCLFAGPMFNETCLLGYTLPLRMDNAVVVQPNRVVVADRQAFGCVLMKDFLRELANKLKRNTTAMENYHRSFVPESTLVNGALTPKEPLTVNVLYKHVQEMLTSEMTLVSDASDSWFKCLKLKLPRGCRCEFQMQYASIGWSVGAILGYAQAEKNRRVLAFIGDGSFQMTAQGISMMLRCEQKSIIFLLNNGGYTIEAVLHDNSYNVIDNWNYTALVEAMDNGRRKCWTAKVKCKEELKEAIEMATGAQKDCLCFIEVFLHRKDASQECLVFGKRVGIAANRPPNPL